jgi:shikimate kinase
MTPKAVLIGLPGSGKSTAGRRLAKILAVEFADSDELIERRCGRAVTAIFASDGEQRFRAVEEQVIVEALGRFDGVLALGGGALGTAGVREALSACAVPVVLLEAPLSTLRTRVGDGGTRPLLAGDPAARLAALAQEREPAYRRAATVSVDTAGLTPGQVAARVAARLHARAVQARSGSGGGDR